jgi:hypothetical protein
VERDDRQTPGGDRSGRSTSDVVAALSQDTEQRLAMLTVSVQEYDIADARPVSG